jgi:hypothetical protein
MCENAHEPVMQYLERRCDEEKRTVLELSDVQTYRKSRIFREMGLQRLKEFLVSLVIESMSLSRRVSPALRPVDQRGETHQLFDQWLRVRCGK